MKLAGNRTIPIRSLGSKVHFPSRRGETCRHTIGHSELWKLGVQAFCRQFYGSLGLLLKACSHTLRPTNSREWRSSWTFGLHWTDLAHWKSLRNKHILCCRKPTNQHPDGCERYQPIQDFRSSDASLGPCKSNRRYTSLSCCVLPFEANHFASLAQKKGQKDKERAHEDRKKSNQEKKNEKEKERDAKKRAANTTD